MGNRRMEPGQCPPRDSIRCSSLDESKDNREKESSLGNKIWPIRNKRKSIRFNYPSAALSGPEFRPLPLLVKLLRNSIIIRLTSASKADAFTKPS